MVLAKLPVPGRPTIWIIVGQGPTALAVGAGGSCLDIFTLNYPFFPLSPSLWETARYRLKYCLKGRLNPKPTNQHLWGSKENTKEKKLADPVLPTVAELYKCFRVVLNELSDPRNRYNLHYVEVPRGVLRSPHGT